MMHRGNVRGGWGVGGISLRQDKCPDTSFIYP